MAQTRGSRMVTFGAVMLMLVGAFNVLDGIVAVASATYFDADHLLFSDLNTWGLFFIVYGVVQCIVGAAVPSGNPVAVWLGIVIAAFNALAQLAYVAHYPAWSIAMVVVDVIVIYALATYGTALDRDTMRDTRPRRDASPSEIRAAGPRVA